MVVCSDSPSKLSLIDLVNGEETTLPVPYGGPWDWVQVLSFPLALFFNNGGTGDVTVYNVVTGQVVGRTRLDRHDDPQSVDSNGNLVIAADLSGYTLLGLSDETGREEMWRRELDIEYMKIAINKTCVVMHQGNEVIVDNYWMVLDDETSDKEDEDDESTEEEDEGDESTKKKKENDETIEEEDEGGDDYGSTGKIMEKEVGGNVEDGKGGMKDESGNEGNDAAGDGEKEGAEEGLVEGVYEGVPRDDGQDELEGEDSEPKMKMRKKNEI